MKDRKVRVRFAPSPTGPLHIGGVRTALYNFLFARKNKGDFILRIEDTDQHRFVPGAEDYISESLNWLGIVPDESPAAGGPFAPYRQSERKNIYLDYAKKLVEAEHAYYAFDTPDELEKARNSFSHDQNQFQYNHSTRLGLRNSLSLNPDEANQLVSGGSPYVIRIKIPVNEEIQVLDSIRGKVIVNSSSLDDKVIMKSDGMPTYHLANVVDDHLMNITHVIRGEEWLPSAPLHVLLYKFFGWIETMPEFAHLPLLLKPEGTGKLSKRDADKSGFPIFPLSWTDPVSGEKSMGFREQGYLPEATLNFLAFLGWNPGTEEELFNKEELINAFSLDRVNKSGAKFDIEKAKFFNQQYIRKKPVSEFYEMVSHKYHELNISPDPGKLQDILDELKGRVTFPDEFFSKSTYFFIRPSGYEIKPALKNFNSQAEKALNELIIDLESKQGNLTSLQFKEMISLVMDRNSIKPGQVMQIIRVFVTGTTEGIDLMKTLEFLGASEIALRIREGIIMCKVKN